MKKSNSMMLLAALLSGFGADFANFGKKAMRQEKSRHARFNTSKYKPHQGKQECARRVAQMAKADLSYRNGVFA